MSKIIKEAKKLLKHYTSQSKKAYKVNLHNKLMIKYGLKKPQPKNFDSEVYIIACWLHDIGRFSKEDSLKDREKHRKISIKIFDKEFAHLIKDRIKRDKIRMCIAEHSGIRVSKEYPELLTIREADRISFLHPRFTKYYLKILGKEKTQKKLNYNYNELLPLKPSSYALKIANRWKNRSQEIINKL